MEKKKQEFLIWVKAHKKQLILAGISITAIAGIIIGIKNKETLIEFWISLERSVKKATENIIEDARVVQNTMSENADVDNTRKYTPPQISFDVNQHIRTMSGNKHHSAQKALEATALGIDLLPDQTIVDSYKKYVA